MGIKRFFLETFNTNFENLDQTHLTSDSFIQSIGYSSESLVDRSLYCLLKCEKQETFLLGSI